MQFGSDERDVGDIARMQVRQWLMARTDLFRFEVAPLLVRRIPFGTLGGSAPAVSPKYGVTQYRAVGKNHFIQAAGGQQHASKSIGSVRSLNR